MNIHVTILLDQPAIWTVYVHKFTTEMLVLTVIILTRTIQPKGNLLCLVKSVFEKPNSLKMTNLFVRV